MFGRGVVWREVVADGCVLILQISPSVEVLKFGEVMWGGCASKTIKLRNIKRASLPVRLSIWSVSSPVNYLLVAQ